MLNETISSLRKRMGYTQKKFADALHVTQGAVSQWETGRTMPDSQQMFIIADFFGITVDQLRDGDIESKNPGMPTVKVIVDPSTQADGATKADKAIAAELAALSLAEKDNVLAYIRFLKANK